MRNLVPHGHAARAAIITLYAVLLIPARASDISQDSLLKQSSYFRFRSRELEANPLWRCK